MRNIENFRKRLLRGGMVIIGLIIIMLAYELIITIGRTQIQINIRQNEELIYLSTFAEPPQFAIWLENVDNKTSETVFVTHRAGVGDWEGKADVPVALPKWFELFKVNNSKSSDVEKDSPLIVSGATPIENYFSIRAEVRPGSKWICWIEMNLAGDYNEAFPEMDIESLKIDEYSNGQPALLYKSELVAEEGNTYDFELVAQSVWENGEIRVEPVSEGVTTAKHVFEEINIEVIKPKPKLIDRNKITTDN